MAAIPAFLPMCTQKLVWLLQKGIKPRDARYSVIDERGLVIEVFPTGGKLWHYRYRLNGKQHKVNLGRYPDMSLAGAHATGPRRDAGQPRQVASRRKEEEQGCTVGVYDHARLQRSIYAGHRCPRPQGHHATETVYGQTVLPAIASKAVSEVTVEDVRAIIWQKKDHGRDAAAGTVHGVLKRMFDCAMTCGIIATNLALAHADEACASRSEPRSCIESG